MLEIDLNLYFWLVDRGIMDDDQRNKVITETNRIKLHREHSQRLENGVLIGQTMIALKKTLVSLSALRLTGGISCTIDSHS